MRVLVVAIALVASGCNTIFGLHEGTEAPDDDPGDKPDDSTDADDKADDADDMAPLMDAANSCVEGGNEDDDDQDNRVDAMPYGMPPPPGTLLTFLGFETQSPLLACGWDYHGAIPADDELSLDSEHSLTYSPLTPGLIFVAKFADGPSDAVSTLYLGDTTMGCTCSLVKASPNFTLHLLCPGDIEHTTMAGPTRPVMLSYQVAVGGGTTVTCRQPSGALLSSAVSVPLMDPAISILGGAPDIVVDYAAVFKF